MAVCCYGHAVDAVNMLHQVAYLSRELRGEAVAGSIGDIDDCCTGTYHSLDHSRQILIIRPTSILGIELYILDKLLGIAHTTDSTFEDFLTGGVEFVADVVITGAYTCMDSFVPRILQSIGCHTDIILHRTRQRADRRPGDCLADLHYRIEITRT